MQAYYTINFSATVKSFKICRRWLKIILISIYCAHSFYNWLFLSLHMESGILWKQIDMQLIIIKSHGASPYNDMTNLINSITINNT